MKNTASIIPPARPWEKGIHEDYSALVLELEVCRDGHGRVFSNHHLQDEKDQQVAMSWPSCGMEQVAFALLLEAVRRESLLCVLALMSQDPEALNRLMQMSETERAVWIQEMAAKVQQQIASVSERLVENAVQNTVTGMVSKT